MKTTGQTNSGVSAPKNCRQNWRAQVLLACAIVATLLNPLNAIAQQLQTPAGDAVGQVGVLRTQVSTLAQHVGGFQAQLDAARTCPDGFHRLSVRLPVSGAYVTGCFNTPNPCDDTVRNAENVLIRDHARLGRLESSVRTLQQHQSALEQVVTAFLDCGDRDSCIEAANEARERLEDAYNASIQLSGWAIQQNEWDSTAVAEFQRLNQDAQHLLARVTNLEQWRTDVVTPKLADLDRRMGTVEGQVTTLTSQRRLRPRLGAYAEALVIGGPGDGSQLAGGAFGLQLWGHLVSSTPNFVATVRLGSGFAETFSGESRGAILGQLQFGAGYEGEAGRIMALITGTTATSTKWGEGFLGVTGGFGLRGELDISSAFVASAMFGWEWGSGVLPQNGVNTDLSRYHFNVGLAARFW